MSRIALYSFNAGEWSRLIDGRADLAKYGSACRLIENFIPIVQGPARRRSGYRYVATTKTVANRSWMLRFVFAEDQAFVIEVGDRYMRFYRNEARLGPGTPTAWSNLTNYVVGDLVASGGVNYYCILAHINFVPPNATYWYAMPAGIYEIPTIYAIADLTNADGTFALSTAQTGDVIYITHGSYEEQKLTRFGLLDWTIGPTQNSDGPFIGTDPAEVITVQSNVATGACTLTSSAPIFATTDVGTLFLLEAKLIDGVTQWEQAKALLAGVERRVDVNVYISLNAATTGNVRPTHTEGARYDGDTGVQWQYLHSGYGVVSITGFTNSTTVTGTVIKRIPSQAVALASTRWSFAAFNSVRGYPARVWFFKDRKVLARANQQWMSVTGDYDNFAAREAGLVLADSAINIAVTADNNDIKWMADADDLIVGTSGAEFAVGQITTAEVLAPDNIDADRQTAHGGRGVQPVFVGSAVVFAQALGKELREIDFSLTNNKLAANDLNVLAPHVLLGKVVQMAFQQDPHNLIWCVLADGGNVALTLDREQDVIGWHRHPMGGSGQVESAVSIPRSDGAADAIWVQVKRTINGAVTRTIEYMERDFDAAGGDALTTKACFLDSFSAFSGENLTATTMTLTLGASSTWGDPVNDEYLLTASAGTFVAGDVGDKIELRIGSAILRVQVLVFTNATNVTVRADDTVPVALRATVVTSWAWARLQFTNLARLNGALEIDVLGDGTYRGEHVVSAGALTLVDHAINVVVGFRMRSLLQTMRLETGAHKQVDQGRIKRINDVVLRLFETVGGKFGVDDTATEQIENTSGISLYNNPPNLFSGDAVQDWPGGYERDAHPTIIQDEPFPMTIIMIAPDVEVES